MTKLTKGEVTRERILDLAQNSILQKGFAATSIDELTAAAEITKSGFLYHFRDKGDLARQLLERYLKQDDEIFDELQARADELSDDPLHSFLIFLKLLAEMMADMPNRHPGCLTASYSYQAQLFKPDIVKLNAEGVLSWRKRFKRQLENIQEKYPTDETVDLSTLADFISTVMEGGILMSMALDDKTILSKQILLARDYIKRVFVN